MISNERLVSATKIQTDPANPDVRLIDVEPDPRSVDPGIVDLLLHAEIAKKTTTY